MSNSHTSKEELIEDFIQTMTSINSKFSSDVENDLAKIIQKSRHLIYKDQL